MNPRPIGRPSTLRDLVAMLIVALMLAATPGLTPSALAQDVGEETMVDPAATETPAEPVSEAPVEDPAPVEPELPVEEAWPPSEEPWLSDEPILPTDEPVLEEPTVEEVPVDEATATAPPTEEPTLAAPSTDEPTLAVENPPLDPELPTVEPTAEPTVEPTAEPTPSPKPRPRRAAGGAEIGAAAGSTLTMTLTLSPTGSPAAGTSVTGQATWSSIPGGIPTGTIQYRVFNGTGCTGALFSEAGTKTIIGTPLPNGSVPASDPVVMTTAGSFSWQALYGGNANYNAGSACVSQTIVKRTPTLSLSVASAAATAGDAFTFTSGLANATATSAGAITYTVYTSTSCTTTLAASGNPSVKTVAAGVAPSSDAIQINTAGSLGWKVSYAGDANNNAVTSACTTLTVAKRTSTIGLAVSSVTGTTGQGATAQATLSNPTGNAAGVVTFTVYSAAGCATTVTSTTKTAAGGVVPESTPLTINLVTTYWRAVWAGDTNNNGATSACVTLTLAKSNPTITLAVTPTLTPMKAGGTAKGQGTLASTGSTAATSTAGGSAIYYVYKDSACSVIYSTGTAKTVSSRAVGVSSTTTINLAGAVYWRVVYSGDANNNGATSDCVALAVAKSDPTSTLTITPSTTPMKAGSTAKARGTFGSTTTTSTITGNLTYGVYTDSVCATLFSVAGNPHAKTVTNRSTGTSNSFTFPTVGTFYWRMDFAGDANNNPANGPCTAMVVAKSTPTLTLTVYPTTTPMRAGGSAKARFTMASSNATAGGSATYTVYTDSTCSTAMTIAGSPSTVTVVSKVPGYSTLITFPAIGTVYWRATYTGDANNGAATSACVALVVGSSTPTLSLTTSPAGSILVDNAATGSATLTGSTANAGGTATYTVYTDSGCAAQLTAANNPSTVTVVNKIIPSSAAITLSAVGTVYWRVVYGGDIDNGAATSSCVPLTVVKRSPTLSLTITHPVSPMQAGEDATGHAALAGATTAASGTVTYTVYANNVCTVVVVPAKTSAAAVAGGVVDPSDAFTFDSVGTFYWRASYGGDASNNAAASACVALNVVDEAVATIDLSVDPNPVLAGGTAHGAATLAGVTATAGGSVTYTVYADDVCTVEVSPPKVSTVTVVDGIVPNSADLTITQAGTRYWAAVYSGDVNNDGDVSPCVELAVDRATPAVVLSVAPNPVAAGSGAVGTATLTGATSAAAGSATYTVYANNTCATPVSPAKSSAVTVAGAVVPASAALSIQSAGIVYWRVAYAGDANNQAATSPCLAVTIAKASPTLALSVAPGTISVWGTAAGSAAVAGGTTTVTGSVVYTVYADDDCGIAATPAKTSTKTVSGGVVPSASFTFDLAGAVYWQAAYVGDANNAAAESGCVPLTVEGGSLTASVSSVTMTPVGYSSSQQTNTGTMVLTIVDQRGTQDGWSVTLSVSDFAYTGVSPTAQPIPAGAFSIQTSGSPVYVRGQAINGANGPLTPGGAAGPLDDPITVLVANEGYGAGEYTQAYTVVLVIPAGSKAGTYTAVVDAVTSSAP